MLFYFTASIAATGPEEVPTQDPVLLSAGFALTNYQAWITHSMVLTEQYTPDTTLHCNKLLFYFTASVAAPVPESVPTQDPDLLSAGFAPTNYQSWISNSMMLIEYYTPNTTLHCTTMLLYFTAIGAATGP